MSTASEMVDKVSVEFIETDAKFKCPIVTDDKCNADQLTSSEFFIGSCCKNASRWTQETKTYLILQNAQKIYEDSKKEEVKARKHVKDADKKVEAIKKSLLEAEDEAKTARESRDKTKKWRNTVQKRIVFLAAEAIKDDKRELEKTDDDDEEETIGEEIDPDNSCTVCFENYDKVSCVRSAVIPCGHQSCFKCLSSLNPKNCPRCRAQFNNTQLQKLF